MRLAAIRMHTLKKMYGDSMAYSFCVLLHFGLAELEASTEHRPPLYRLWLVEWSGLCDGGCSEGEPDDGRWCVPPGAVAVVPVGTSKDRN